MSASGALAIWTGFSTTEREIWDLGVSLSLEEGL